MNVQQRGNAELALTQTHLYTKNFAKTENRLNIAALGKMRTEILQQGNERTAARIHMPDVFPHFLGVNLWDASASIRGCSVSWRCALTRPGRFVIQLDPRWHQGVHGAGLVRVGCI
jgi:hypothetical protein